jgi:hypothetical protein
MPERHQAINRQRGWNPEYYLKKAEDNGPYTLEFFQKPMDSKLVIDQSYTACLGLLRLMDAYGPERMEAACKTGLGGNKFSYGLIKNILDNNMDLLEEDTDAEYHAVQRIYFAIWKEVLQGNRYIGCLIGCSLKKARMYSLQVLQDVEKPFSPVPRDAVPVCWATESSTSA